MVTINSANAALKTMYLDVVANQLNTNMHPFLTELEKTSQDVVGKLVKRLVPYGVNGGIGAGTESGALPTAFENKYLLFQSTLKNLYGTIEITDKALKASSSDAGAFVNLLTSEMEGLLSSSKWNFARMLYGNGSAFLTNGLATASGENTFIAEKLNNLMVGQNVDIYVNGTLSCSAKILSIDFALKKLTFDINCTEDMADNTKTISLYAKASKDKEITGLGAIFDDSIPTIYSVSKTDYPFLKPISKTTQNLTESDMMAVLDESEEKTGAQINFICGAYDARRAYQNLFKQNKLNVDFLTLAGGYTAITFNGIPFLAEKFVDSNTIYFLNSDDFKIHELGDWSWLENDKGQILKQKEGFPTHTATLVKYAEIVCARPGAQAKLVIE